MDSSRCSKWDGLVTPDNLQPGRRVWGAHDKKTSGRPCHAVIVADWTWSEGAAVYTVMLWRRTANDWFPNPSRIKPFGNHESVSWHYHRD